MSTRTNAKRKRVTVAENAAEEEEAELEAEKEAEKKAEQPSVLVPALNHGSTTPKVVALS